MKKQPSNWIEGMSMELKQKRYQEQKDFVLRIFVYLILIPSMSVLMWYMLYKLVMWIFS